MKNLLLIIVLNLSLQVFGQVTKEFHVDGVLKKDSLIYNEVDANLKVEFKFEDRKGVTFISYSGTSIDINKVTDYRAWELMEKTELEDFIVFVVRSGSIENSTYFNVVAWKDGSMVALDTTNINRTGCMYLGNVIFTDLIK